MTLDLTEAVEAAAEAMHEDWRARNTASTSLLPWAECDPGHKHRIRESVLPGVNAAATVIAAQVGEQITVAIEDLQAREGLRLGRNRESDGARVYTPTEEARIVALSDAKAIARTWSAA